MRFLVLAATLTLGAAIGWAIAPELLSPRSPGSVSSPAPGVPAAGPAGAGLPPPSLGPTPHAPDPDFGALLDEFPVPSYARGPGVIRGTVVRVGDETPVEGVAIDAIIHGTSPGVEPQGIGHPDLTRFIREEIDQFHYDAAMARRAVTDAQGRFQIDGLPADAEYHLHPAPSDEWYLWTSDRTIQLSPGDSVEYRAAPVGFVTVEVREADGSPVPAGWIRTTDPLEEFTGSFSHRFDPATRRIRVPIPYTELTASTLDRRSSEPLALDLRAGEEADIVLEIEVDTGIDAVVTAADPIDLYGVELCFVSLEERMLPADLGDLYYRGRTVTPDPVLGSCSVSVPPGPTIVLLFRGGTVHDHVRLELGEGRREVVLRAPPLDRTRLALVEVRGPDGTPVEGVSFHMYARMQSESGGASPYYLDTEAKGLGEGRSILIIDEPDPSHAPNTLELVGHELHLQAPGFGAITAPVSVGAGGIQRYSFPEPAFLTLDLLDYLGHDLQGRITVQVAPPDEDFGWAVEGTIDAVGRVTFSPLAPGPRRLRATIRRGGWGWNENPILDEPLTLASGENHRAVPLPELYSLAVRFPRSAAAQGAWLQTVGGEHAGHATIDREGWAEFSDLRPGRYQVHGDHRLEWMEVPIPGEARVVFAPEVMHALRVTVTEREGWLARTGFLEGDRIVGLDGKSFDDVRRLRFAVIRALATGRGTIEVARGDEGLELAIPEGEPISIHEIGGDLEAVTEGGDR